jgi:hypothetical protein
MRDKFIAGFEMLVLIVSLFALCYFVDLNEELISSVSAASSSGGVDYGNMTFDDWVDYFSGGTLIEEESWISYPISSGSEGAGCCFISKEGQICGTAVPENCLDDSPFAEGALCAGTAFCEKGCCYDESLGIFDKNVLEFACPRDWVRDANCNMPAARLGCCILGENSIFETRGQCETDSLTRAVGGSVVVDWRENVGEAECISLSAEQKEGACVLEEGGCKFVSEGDCLSYNGEFVEGFLCTSPSLNTSCEMSEQTECVEGKDGVYFVDSCGNRANIYDSARVSDSTYWDRVVLGSDLCGDLDVEGGNANSADCGNCNRFLGGICASAGEDNFEVDVGGFYCRDTSCMFDGTNYENGESWCVYDGAIGEGKDVVGSRHWKYVCSQGKVMVEPCSDYRNQICIQSKSVEIDGVNVDFSNAACVANNWRECINLNSEKEDAMEKCEEALNCRVERVDIADSFKFNICLPEYPAGFSFNDERYVKTAESLCSMGSQTCTVVRAPKTWGGCDIVANRNCLSGTFAQEMNDFCMGLGDCGGSVNILGEYSENYVVRRDGALNRGMFLSETWIDGLKILAEPVLGQFAEVEDYSEYLEAAGILGGPEDPVATLEGDGPDVQTFATGLGGLGMAGMYAAGYLSGAVTASGSAIGLSSVGFSASVSAFSGVAIGAAIGMVAGMMLAKQLGLSEGGSILMAIGGALVGGALAYAVMFASLATIGPIGWAIIIIGVILMIIGSFFGGSDCPAIEIAFECRAWQPPVGGDDCLKCNGDPLKPCSQYRCESLGSACELINVGTGEELCVDGNPNDVTPPVMSRQNGISFYDGTYVDSEEGFDVVGIGGGCLEAYTPLAFGVVTSEPSQCRFDVVAESEFEDMDFLLGSNSYLYNHTTVFSLPDPSHGQSQGIDWTGELELFVRCRDRHDILSPGFLRIGMCVAEGEDLTAPKIVKSFPESGGLVGFEKSEQDVVIVTGEFASCKWDLVDKEYSDMANSFSCEDKFGAPSNIHGYECLANFPIGNTSRDYFVRCMDQPWLEDLSERNAMKSSFVLRLNKPEKKISIDKIKPDSDFEISSDFATIDLKIATSGGGKSHFCSYSFSGYERMIELFETGTSRTHSQDNLNRRAGMQNIYVQCRDETGEFARGQTSFNIIRDTLEPAVARVWQVGGFVNLVLVEDGECRFSFDSCTFPWDEGNVIGSGTELRFGVVRGEKYYIRCRDDFGNMPAKCSVEVMAT